MEATTTPALVTLGETMALFTSERVGPLRHAATMRVGIAGAEGVAGYLAGVLDGRAGPDRVRIGAACGAFAVTVAGDWEGLPTREELDLLGHGDGTVLR
jgi:sugar/nucleoside kinase (ribokinase family)